MRREVPAGLRRVLAGVATVVCPSDLTALGIVDQVVAGAYAGLRALPPLTRTPLEAGIRLYGLSARAAAARGVTAAEHFERWWSSSSMPRRAVAKALRALLVLPYYEHPEITARLGYDGRAWVEERGAAWRARHADDLAEHRRILTEPEPR